MATERHVKRRAATRSLASSVDGRSCCPAPSAGGAWRRSRSSRAALSRWVVVVWGRSLAPLRRLGGRTVTAPAPRGRCAGRRRRPAVCGGGGGRAVSDVVQGQSRAAPSTGSEATASALHGVRCGGRRRNPGCRGMQQRRCGIAASVVAWYGCPLHGPLGRSSCSGRRKGCGDDPRPGGTWGRWPLASRST